MLTRGTGGRTAPSSRLADEKNIDSSPAVDPLAMLTSPPLQRLIRSPCIYVDALVRMQHIYIYIYICGSDSYKRLIRQIFKSGFSRFKASPEREGGNLSKLWG